VGQKVVRLMVATEADMGELGLEVGIYFPSGYATQMTMPFFVEQSVTVRSGGC